MLLCSTNFLFWKARQLRNLSRGVPSSHLEKDERLILGHICIYSWKRHALCYAVFGFTRNRWLNTLCGIVWETKHGRFTTLNIPKCEHFTLFVCPLRFLVISAMRRLGNVQSFKTNVSLLSFLPWTRPRLGGWLHLDMFTWQIVTPADRVTHLADRATRPGGSPHVSCKRDQNKIRNYRDRRVTPLRRVTSPTWGPPPPCKQAPSSGQAHRVHFDISFIIACLLSVIFIVFRLLILHEFLLIYWFQFTRKCKQLQ